MPTTDGLLGREIGGCLGTNVQQFALREVFLYRFPQNVVHCDNEVVYELVLKNVRNACYLNRKSSVAQSFNVRSSVASHASE
jgi:hypothetical protein